MLRLDVERQRPENPGRIIMTIRERVAGPAIPIAKRAPDRKPKQHTKITKDCCERKMWQALPYSLQVE
jgi:hypothetical protein